MEVTGMSYKEKFDKDQLKLEMAKRNGFRVFRVRSDFTPEQKK